MKGAREYYNLFEGKSQVIDRLYLQIHKHARGKCFEIYVMPEGGKPNQYGHAPSGSVLVYGMTGGQRGWTETYGWLKEGKWQDDFEALVIARRDEIAESNKDRDESTERQKRDAHDTQSALLATY